jgi:hypothetical protein
MSFPCTKCGLCCKNITNVVGLEDFHQGDGVCIYYHSSGECLIYQDRPLICRVEEGYNAFFSYFEKEVFYQKNAEICNQLQEQAGMNVFYRVRL